MEHKNCGYVDVGYPVDSIGNTHIWKCECGTTNCQKPVNFFEEIYKDKQVEEDFERKFYDYHLTPRT